MFDIGLFELIAIGTVSLIVIGPERLPGAIRTGALWFGRFKHMILDARKEIEQQIGADEIKKQLRNERVMAELEKLDQARLEIEQSINEVVSNAEIEALPNHAEDNSHGELIEHDDQHIDHEDYDEHHEDYDEHHEDYDEHHEDHEQAMDNENDQTGDDIIERDEHSPSVSLAAAETEIDKKSSQTR